MKHGGKIGFLAVLLLSAAIAVQASPNNTPPGKENGQGTAVQHRRANKDNVLGGKNDQRLITPGMTARERVEVWRDLKKRARAKRNQLIMAHAHERNNQVQSTGLPPAPSQ